MIITFLDIIKISLIILEEILGKLIITNKTIFLYNFQKENQVCLLNFENVVQFSSLNKQQEAQVESLKL